MPKSNKKPGTNKNVTKEFWTELINEIEEQLLDHVRKDIIAKTKRENLKRSIITREGRKCHKMTPLEMVEFSIAGFRQAIKFEQPITKTGLAHSLKATSKMITDWAHLSDKLEGLDTRSNRFVYIIRRLLGFVEMYNEVEGHNAVNPAFHKFILTNMGWSEKQVIEQFDAGTSLSEQQRKKMKNALLKKIKENKENK